YTEERTRARYRYTAALYERLRFSAWSRTWDKNHSRKLHLSTNSSSIMRYEDYDMQTLKGFCRSRNTSESEWKEAESHRKLVSLVNKDDKNFRTAKFLQLPLEGRCIIYDYLLPIHSYHRAAKSKPRYYPAISATSKEERALCMDVCGLYRVNVVPVDVSGHSVKIQTNVGSWWYITNQRLVPPENVVSALEEIKVNSKELTITLDPVFMLGMTPVGTPSLCPGLSKVMQYKILYLLCHLNAYSH
ncbi:hypothetical protein H2203_004077, partial [Taxawa tesnikishii (nom. ined.)]